MRRDGRCDHMFMPGLCRHPGCEHEEKPGKPDPGRRARPKVCSSCKGEATIRVNKRTWICKGCHDLREMRGAREHKHGFTGLYLLTALLLGCGGIDVPTVATPGACGLWDHVLSYGDPEFWSDEGPGRCLWVHAGENQRLSPAGDCPGDASPACAVLFDGEQLELWRSVGRQNSDALYITFGLRDDGSCPVACNSDCAPLPRDRTICAPCGVSIGGEPVVTCE